MKPATLPNPAPGSEKLLRIDPRKEAFSHHRVKDLASLLGPGDCVVVNDAATMPASLFTAAGDLELRFVRKKSDAWTAVVFGRGNVRVPTEHRPDPPRLRVGQRLDFGDGFGAEIVSVHPEQPRLVDVRFEWEGARFWSMLYAKARPVQYAYLERELELWHFQNRYASRPWAFEMPSAGHCLSWEVLSSLRARDIAIASITHAAGISSTGSPSLDSMFPLPERYEIERAAVAAVDAARARGGRVVAVGTTVVRALESSFAAHGRLFAEVGEARLLLGPGFRPNVVDGILSGMHEPGTSHFALLEAFASRALLERAVAEADAAGYLQHEFGDAMLVLASREDRLE
jgi:S-adenosylmethionine:tRNA ribosyltransferase-isomerase